MKRFTNRNCIFKSNRVVLEYLPVYTGRYAIKQRDGQLNFIIIPSFVYLIAVAADYE